jgi:hypothetical protein
MRLISWTLRSGSEQVQLGRMGAFVFLKLSLHCKKNRPNSDDNNGGTEPTSRSRKVPVRLYPSVVQIGN